MREQTIYIANDGKKFDDELECLKYENECLLHKCSKKFNMWDKSGTPTNDFEATAFMRIETPEDKEYIERICEKEGLNSPWNYWCCYRDGNIDNNAEYNYGCLYYDTAEDVWHNIKSLEDRVNKIKFIFDNDIVS